MKDVLFMQDVNDTMVSTSLLKMLLSLGYRIHLICDSSTVNLFKYYKGIRCDAFSATTNTFKYDLLINTSPMESYTIMAEKIDAKEKLGYGANGSYLRFFNKGAELHYKCRYIGVANEANIFQLYYGLANLTWEGQGYWLNYYPKNRCKKGLVGLCLNNQKLYPRILQLKLTDQKFWFVQFKKNILKQIDEVNRCKTIITDDLNILHISLALRKHVEYITYRPLPYNIVTFSNCVIHVLYQ